MKKIILSICCLAITSGCQKSQDNSSSNSAATGVADVSNVAGFESAREIPNENQPGHQEYLQKRFGSSCEIEKDADGTVLSIEPRREFDSRLKVGDTAYVLTTLNVQQGTLQSQRRVTVKELTKDQAVNETSLISMSYLQMGEVLARPLVETQTCELTAGPDSIDCSGEKKNLDEMKEYFTESGYNEIKKNPDLDLSECTIPNSTLVKFVVEEGTYQLQNERKVSAYRETSEKKGMVICQGHEVGEGTEVSTVVTSSEVKPFPSDFTGASSCGGSVVFRSSVAKIGDKVLSSSRLEYRPEEATKDVPAPAPLASK